jgi:hypothetical protein
MNEQQLLQSITELSGCTLAPGKFSLDDLGLIHAVVEGTYERGWRAAVDQIRSSMKKP